MTDERTAVASFLKMQCAHEIQFNVKRKEEEEIPKWEAYIEFNEHALEEIATEVSLDRWFADSHDAAASIHRLSAEDMEHVSEAVG